MTGTADNTPEHGRVLAVSSGKGGVGKTNISVNLAIALGNRGKRVCVFDADTSLANVNILLNIAPRFTLEHVLDGSRSILEILVTGPGGITIVPAASGIAEFASLTVTQQKLLLQGMRTLEAQFDYLIIDTAAGISENVTTFLDAAEHCLLIVTPEPTSLTDAFALMKVMRKRQCQTHIHVLTNMVDSYPGSVDIFKRLNGASIRYLQTQISYLGYVPRDEYVRLSVQRQIPVTVGFPSCQASYRFHALADSIEGIYRQQPSRRSFSLFWRKLLQKRLQGGSPPLQVPVSAQEALPAEPAASSRPATAPRFAKAAIVKMQQNLVQLVRSRTLSPASMRSLVSSLITQIDRYYPEIDVSTLQQGRPGDKGGKDDPA
jgi:flagellar biosynthesis protein FlhG